METNRQKQAEIDRRSIEEYSRDFKNSVLTSINANANNIVMEPCASSVHESPDDFEILSVLGKGAYGVVVQVLCKSNHQIYAMKIIKKEILKQSAEKQYMKSERAILTKIHFPFLIKLLCSFQTPKCLYIIMEYCSGGELFHFIEKDCFLKEDIVRYYACEMIVAIEHLHSLNILHRDLKPENILLDSQGHIYITDFGFAKIHTDVNEQSKTICGTYTYMAPEMIKGSGYGSSVDWWSLGCLLYQMFTGDPPFTNQNIKQLQKDILTRTIKYPSYLSSSAHSLLKGLLTKDPSQRLGSRPSTAKAAGGVTELKCHPFFKDVNWEDVLQKRIPPPFNPATSTKKSCDQSKTEQRKEIPVYMTRDHFDTEFLCMSYGSVMEPKDRSSSKDQTLLEDDLFKGFSYVSEDFINTPRAEEDPNLDLYLEQLKQEREDLIKQQEEKKKQAMKKLKKNKKKQQNQNKKKQNNKNEAKQEQESSQELLFTTSPIEPVAETSEDCLLTKAIHQSSSK